MRNVKREAENTATKKQQKAVGTEGAKGWPGAGVKKFKLVVDV